MTRQDRIRDLHQQGLSGRAIAAELGISPPTVSYYLRKLGVLPQVGRHHDWSVVQKYYDAGHSVRECLEHFALSSQTWHAAKMRRAITTRPSKMTIDVLLGGGARNRNHIKDRLIRAGVKSGHCERCGLRRWMDAALSLDLHHVNGDGGDNRLENLELLCPNCHRQTSTFGGRRRAPTPA